MDARTRDAEKSIWLHLSEDTFRQHLVNLEEKTNAVPIAPQAFAATEWLPTAPLASKTQHTLPLAIEQQLTDDFACLVAVGEGAQSVAAVCLEERQQGPPLTLRFAALDVSLNDAVKITLQEVSAILSNVAAGNRPVSDPEDGLFHSIIHLHHRRLLARLRSCKWDKPKYLSKSHKKPLWQDMAALIHRAQFAYTKKEKAARVLVEKLMNELAAVYELFELASEGTELTEMEKVVRASYEFSSMPAIKEYLVRLESGIGVKPTSQVASAIKSLRQIQKIALFRRISISLPKIAKGYPSLFESGITFAYLTPYKGVPTTIGYEEWATTCHVHAEVQLAVHYDLISRQERQLFHTPRALGISKSLCYLCYRFLRAHQGFFPSRTHGRLYDQWTMPDLAEFEEDIVTRYRSIIKNIDEEVVRHTEDEPELCLIEPMTSIDVYSTTSDIG